ncbi:hypothetical protein CIPAW_01G250500 [Carya illinoinensis]|uniref:Uncharacterized protein n=1 Tax=Carya illinoinensis TaxID=32201 RepID=A0A8T1RTH4_CARIL|nr:hypothetical protein CIPAW_01G250500 [Carya illinoinensis]
MKFPREGIDIMTFLNDIMLDLGFLGREETDLPFFHLVHTVGHASRKKPSIQQLHWLKGEHVLCIVLPVLKLIDQHMNICLCETTDAVLILRAPPQIWNIYSIKTK